MAGVQPARGAVPARVSVAVASVARMDLRDEYARLDSALRVVVDAVPAAAWDAPSPCEGWSARDVVRHLVRTQREFLGTHGADLGPEPDVDADPAGAWRAHADAVTALLADDAFVAHGFDGFFGPTTVGATLRAFYLFDMVVHRWDVARAAGVPTVLTDAELDAVERSADAFGETAYRMGVFREGVTAPAGADRATRVLARLGRVA